MYYAMIITNGNSFTEKESLIARRSGYSGTFNRTPYPFESEVKPERHDINNPLVRGLAASGLLLLDEMEPGAGQASEVGTIVGASGAAGRLTGSLI